MKVEDIISAMPSLSQDDLKKVIAMAATLKKVEDGQHDRLYEILAEVFYKRAAIKLPPKLVLSRQAFFKNYRDTRDSLELYVSESGLPTSIEEDALIALIVDCVFHNMTKAQVPISPQSVFLNLPKFATYMNNSYPGYAANKMLSALVTLQLNP